MVQTGRLAAETIYDHAHSFNSILIWHGLLDLLRLPVRKHLKTPITLGHSCVQFNLYKQSKEVY